MTAKKNVYPNPKFTSMEEDQAYWEDHSPPAEGYEGEMVEAVVPRPKLVHILAVRLTGEELTQLRDIAAAKQGLGPSTFARILVQKAIDRAAGDAALPETPSFTAEETATLKRLAHASRASVGIPVVRDAASRK